MNILALGGCGDMGRMAIAILLESPKVSSITVADIDIELANAVVELIGSDKLKAKKIDVKDRDNLIELIKAHDLVVNTVGPYFRFGKLIFEAVIEAKRNYVDICDDWKPMQEILSMDAQAKQAGITAIIGIGASPGLSNILAVVACNELDEVDDLISAWGVSFSGKKGKRPKFYVKTKAVLKKLNRKMPEANAAFEHLLHESVGKIPTFKDGKLIEIDALTEAPPLNFPGSKKMYAAHIGHPEPVTLCRTLKAKSISNQMFLGKKATEIVRIFAKKLANKSITMKEATIQIEKKIEALIIKYIILFWKMLKEYNHAPPTICIVATGQKDGIKKRIGVGIYYKPYDTIEGLAGITSVPLAVATMMLIDGKITEKGALTPEEAIDSDEFFNRMAPYCGKNLSGKDLIIIREELI